MYTVQHSLVYVTYHYVMLIAKMNTLGFISRFRYLIAFILSRM